MKVATLLGIGILLFGVVAAEAQVVYIPPTPVYYTAPPVVYTAPVYAVTGQPWYSGPTYYAPPPVYYAPTPVYAPTHRSFGLHLGLSFGGARYGPTRGVYHRPVYAVTGQRWYTSKPAPRGCYRR